MKLSFPRLVPHQLWGKTVVFSVLRHKKQFRIDINQLISLLLGVVNLNNLLIKINLLCSTAVLHSSGQRLYHIT